MTKCINLENKKFGTLICLKLDETSKKKWRSWICKCDCVNIKSISQCHLSSGHTKSCGCLFKNEKRKNWTGYGEISGDRFYEISTKMRHKELGFNVSIKEIWNLFLKQEKKCNLSGEILFFSRKKRSFRKCSVPGLHRALSRTKWLVSDIRVLRG